MIYRPEQLKDRFLITNIAFVRLPNPKSLLSWEGCDEERMKLMRRTHDTSDIVFLGDGFSYFGCIGRFLVDDRDVSSGCPFVSPLNQSR